MNEKVISCAEALAAAIEECEEFKDFNEACTAYEQDGGLQEKLRRYDALQKELVALHEPQVKNDALIDIKMQSFKALRDELVAHPTMVRFLQAQDELNAVMGQVQAILQRSVGGEEEAGCGGNCAGCGGCH